MLLIYDSSRRQDLITTIYIVNASKRPSLDHVPGHSEIVDAVKRDQAARTWTGTKITNTGNEDSVYVLHERNPLVSPNSLTFLDSQQNK